MWNSEPRVFHPVPMLRMVERMDPLADLRQATQELADLDTRRTQVMNRRDDLLLAALAAGTPWSQLEALYGLSRRSIQKIREKHGIAKAHQ